MSLDNPHDPDRQIGEIFQKLSALRVACGEAALTRCVSAVLVTLGASAMPRPSDGPTPLRNRPAPARATSASRPGRSARDSEPFDESIGPS